MSVPYKVNGWALIDPKKSGKIYEYVGLPNADPDDLPVDDVGSGSLAFRQDGKRYLFHEDSGWIEVSL